jgi:hypothetical protein
LDWRVFLVVPGKYGDPEDNLALWHSLAPTALGYGYPLASVGQFDARPEDVL